MYNNIQETWRGRDADQAVRIDEKEVAKFRATQQEAKQKSKDIYEEDERAAIVSLAKEGGRPSQSSKMFLNWNLGRGKVRKIPRHMADNRELQTTFGNLIGGTRFKSAKKRTLKRNMCPNCKENIDTWKHCVGFCSFSLGEIKNAKG